MHWISPKALGGVRLEQVQKEAETKHNPTLVLEEDIAKDLDDENEIVSVQNTR